MSDSIDRQKAIRLVHSVLYEMMVDAAATEIEKPMSKEDKLLLRVNKVVCTKLKELPSAEPDPSDVARDIATIIENEKDMRVIAQPIRKGKWIEAWRSGLDGVRKWHWECSECGFELNFNGCIDPEETLAMYNFCPNCGADMRGEEE